MSIIPAIFKLEWIDDDSCFFLNDYFERVEIIRIRTRYYVKHYDIGERPISFSVLFARYNLSDQEILLIVKAAKELEAKKIVNKANGIELPKKRISKKIK